MFQPSLSTVNNMASINTVELNMTVTPFPPHAPQEPGYERGFKYRGTLFRPSSGTARSDNMMHSVIQDFSDIKEKNLRDSRCSTIPPSAPEITPTSKTPSKSRAMGQPRRIQSAKGRLEKNNKNSDYNSSLHSLSSVPSEEECGMEMENRPSILNLNSVVDVPNKEEELLAQRVNLLNKQDNELNHKPAMRPSSAKAAFGCPLSAAETKVDFEETTGAIKPCVYGLKLGRQVFGSESHVLEAWSNIDKEYPFRLSDNLCQPTQQIVPFDENGRKIRVPSTLEPLHQWLRQDTLQDITGIDPGKCLVFLSQDYHCDELPEVPCPQTADADLPYSCVVATPRPQTTRKYEHSVFDREPALDDHKCNHTKAFNPETHGDISFLLHPPILRNPQEIRQEIKELEDLLQGIGSVNSNCSFVQFQAEITLAKSRARKLIKKRLQEPEPIDTFGLLKFCREHDEIIKSIHETRNRLLAELALLEQNSSSLETQ